MKLGNKLVKATKVVKHKECYFYIKRVKEIFNQLMHERVNQAP